MIERAKLLTEEYDRRIRKTNYQEPSASSLEHAISFPELRSLDRLCKEALIRALPEHPTYAENWYVNEDIGANSPEHVHSEFVKKKQIMLAALHVLEAEAGLKASASARGAFIPMGNAFDAMTAIGKVLTGAKHDLLIVDPYMDEKALTDFGLLAPESVFVRLLADEHNHKPTLQPAVDRWKKQYGQKRPLAARLDKTRRLHDRLIFVDRADVWILTQSLKDFAARSPASMVRTDSDAAALKVGDLSGPLGRSHADRLRPARGHWGVKFPGAAGGPSWSQKRKTANVRTRGNRTCARWGGVRVLTQAV